MGGEDKMKTKKIALGGIVALSFVILSAHEVKAEDMLQLANQKGCLACHQMDKQVVGPAWIEVSKKYTEKDIPQLVNSVLNGVMGKWGQVPMPANKGFGHRRRSQKTCNMDNIFEESTTISRSKTTTNNGNKATRN